MVSSYRKSRPISIYTPSADSKNGLKLELKEIATISTGLASLVGVGVIVYQALQVGFMPSFTLQDAASLLLALLIISAAFFVVMIALAAVPSAFLSDILEDDSHRNGSNQSWNYLQLYYFLNIGTSALLGIDLLALIKSPYNSLLVWTIILAGIGLFLSAFCPLHKIMRDNKAISLPKFGILLVSSFTTQAIVTLLALEFLTVYPGDILNLVAFPLICFLIAVATIVFSLPGAPWFIKLAAPTLLSLLGIPLFTLSIFPKLGLADRDLQSMQVDSEYLPILKNAGFSTVGDNGKYAVITDVHLAQRIGSEFVITPQNQKEFLLVLPKEAVKSFGFAGRKPIAPSTPREHSVTTSPNPQSTFPGKLPNQ